MSSTTHYSDPDAQTDAEARKHQRHLNQWRDRVEARFQARRRLGGASKFLRTTGPAEIVLGEG